MVSIALIVTLFNIVDIVIRHRNPYPIYHLVVISIVLVLLLTDVALNTVFVIGGHTVSETMYHIIVLFYYYTVCAVPMMGKGLFQILPGNPFPIHFEPALAGGV